MNESKERLLPCPFCPPGSSEQELELEPGCMPDAWWRGVCDSGCAGPWKPTKAEAEAAWNTRHRASNWVRVETDPPETGSYLCLTQFGWDVLVWSSVLGWGNKNPWRWQHLPPPPEEE